MTKYRISPSPTDKSFIVEERTEYILRDRWDPVYTYTQIGRVTKRFTTQEAAEEFIQERLKLDKIKEIRDKEQAEWISKHPPRVYPSEDTKWED